MNNPDGFVCVELVFHSSIQALLVVFQWQGRKVEDDLECGQLNMHEREDHR
jgi:hypothetical protein